MKKIILIVFLLAIPLFSYAEDEREFGGTTVEKENFTKVPTSSSEESSLPVTLPIPQSRFNLQTLDQDFTPPKIIHIEFTGSSWAPTRMTGDSNLLGTSNFYHTGLPQLSLNGWSTGWDIGKAVNVAPKIGFSFAQYERSGYLPINGTTVELTQKMNLYSFFLGLETSMQKYFFGHLQPYLDLGVMPAWAQAPATSFNKDGTSNVYWAAKEAVGLAWRFFKVKETPTADVALNVGFETTQGLGKSDLSDSGFLAGLRLGL